MARVRQNKIAVGLGALAIAIALVSQATVAQSNPPPNTATVTIPCAVDLQISAAGKPLLDDALKSFRAEQEQAAIDTYKNLIAKNIDTPYAYAGLTRIYLRQNKTADAYAAAQNAGAAGPNTIPAQVALGEIYFRQGRVTDAERAFISACGNDAHAYLSLARLYEVTANFRKAAEALASARRLAPDDPDIRWAWRYGSGNETRHRPREVAASADLKTEGTIALSTGTAAATITPPATDEHPCRIISKAAGTQIGMDPVVRDGPSGSSSVIGDRAAAYLLAVKLDGTTAKLEVDTGSDGILISRKLAEKAGIKPIAKQKFAGLGDNGPVDSFIGLANSVKVGDIEFQGCYVSVSDRKLPMAGADGLISPVIFEDFLVELNFPDAKLKLSPLPPIPDGAAIAAVSGAHPTEGFPEHDRYIAPEMKSYTPVYRFGSDILVATIINSSAPKLFSLDTGSFDDIITPAAAREVTHVASDDSMIVKGLSGNVAKVGTADRLTIQFGHLKQDRSDTVTLDLAGISRGLGTEVSGILGFGMLRMIDIKIDYRDALVDFSYNPNRLH